MNQLGLIISSNVKLDKAKDDKKAKNSYSPNHWLKFKSARNEVIDLIRKSKQKYNDSLSDKLRFGSFSSRDWWEILKGFI